MSRQREADDRLHSIKSFTTEPRAEESALEGMDGIQPALAEKLLVRGETRTSNREITYGTSDERPPFSSDSSRAKDLNHFNSENLGQRGQATPKMILHFRHFHFPTWMIPMLLVWLMDIFQLFVHRES